MGYSRAQAQEGIAEHSTGTNAGRVDQSSVGPSEVAGKLGKKKQQSPQFQFYQGRFEATATLFSSTAPPLL